MSLFEMHNLIIDEYCKYVQSFLSIADERVREFIEKELLDQSTLWPEALLQFFKKEGRDYAVQDENRISSSAEFTSCTPARTLKRWLGRG